MNKQSYCATHNACPIDGEPCWQCANPHILKAVEGLKAENDVRKQWQGKAVDSLLFWLEGKDDIDFTIHADRLLRDLCNCEDEMPPCEICHRLALLPDATPSDTPISDIPASP